MNRKTLLSVTCSFVACCAVGVGTYLYLNQASAANTLLLENNATIGMLPGTDPALRQQQLQTMLDESMIAFSINTSPVFSKDGTGNLMVENPANNAKLLTAQIILQEGNQTLYQSGALKPGSYLQTVSLTQTPPPGVYEATVYLKAYREGDQALIGQTGAQIKLTVMA